jgi:hypothetical protein
MDEKEELEIKAIEDYSINSPFKDSKNNEVEILSNNLLYSEIGDTHAGVQCRNMDNQDEIFKRCVEISKLIKEIEKLNQL